MGLEGGQVVDQVPGEVQRNGRRGAAERVDDGAILELVEHRARLAGAGEAGEAGAAGADAPGRDRDAEAADLRRDRLDVETATGELAPSAA